MRVLARIEWFTKASQTMTGFMIGWMLGALVGVLLTACLMMVREPTDES